MNEEPLVDATPTPSVDLPQVVHDIAEVLPVEALPVDAIPVHAVSWFSRLIGFFSLHAYFLAFFGALIENTILLGFLLPGGAVVALAGAGGRQANLSLPLLIFLSAAGMCGGALIDYYLGRAGIVRVLHHPLMGTWGTRFAARLEEAEPLLRRHGWWMMLMAHAFGTGRSSLAVAAGASGLPLKRFMVMEVPAALLWSAGYAGGGYVLASQWSTFELILRRVGWVGSVGLLIFVVGWLIWHRRKGGAPDRPPTGTAPAPAAGAAVGVNGSTVARAYAPAVAAPAVAAPPTQEPRAPRPARQPRPAESSSPSVEPLR